MHPLLARVANYMKENGLLEERNTVVVAVSGGADSVALLDMLHSLTELRLNLVVAHLNHKLRGEEADEDAAFVEELARRHGLPCAVRATDVHQLSLERKLSLEEAGREARYAWFAEVARDCRADAVALAHHADDQAETVLMRLLRGSGTTGLAGIPLRSAGRYIRPLLCATRAEIEDYLRCRNLCFRTDHTNSDTRFLRNRIRHELLPYLKTYNPAIAERLAATAELLAADESLLETVTGQAFTRHATVNRDEIVMQIPSLQQESIGLRYRLYRKALQTVQGDLAHVAMKHVRQVDALLQSDKAHAETDLPGGLRVTKSYGELRFSRGTGTLQEHAPFELLVAGPGSYPLPHGRMLTVCETGLPEDPEKIAPGRAVFDHGEAPFPWLVRTFRNGDRFTPLGMQGSKKVKDFFIEMKIPRQIRAEIPLFFCGGELIWIGGLRPSHKGRITEKTQACVAAEIADPAS